MSKKIKIYALSTCIWCKKTIEYFNKKNIKFEHIYVDLLDQPEKTKVMKELESLNPKANYPTISIGDKVIVGYKVKDFEEELDK